MLVIVSSFFWSSTWWWLVVLLRDTGWRQWLDSRVNPDRIKPKRDHQNQNDMPWPFCWHGDLQRLGGSSKVTAWITKWPTCPIFLSKVFLGEGFWKQDLVKHPEKKRQKKMDPKKKPYKMDPQKPFLLNLGGTLRVGIQTPPVHNDARCPTLEFFCQKKLMAGDYASYNDCGVVNGLTADAFIVAGWFFSGKKPLRWGGNTEPKLLKVW